MANIVPLGAALLAGILSVSAYPASADTYPTQTIRLIVPYTAGGTQDLLARTISQRLTEILGQSMIVENRPGGGGVLAAQQAARSKPDGYTLLLSDIRQLAINPYLYAKLPYDPVRDFAPVTLIGGIPLFIMVNPSLNVTNLEQLAKLAQANPGELTYATPGVGTIHHIAMETVKSAFRMDITHIPYPGGSQAMADVIAGRVSMTLFSYNILMQALEAGKGRVIATTSLKPSPQLPEVPPVSSLMPGYDFSSKIGVVAPAGTPHTIIAKLSDAIREALKRAEADPKLSVTFRNLGIVLTGSTPEEYAKDIREDLVRFEKAVKISGAKVQ